MRVEHSSGKVRPKPWLRGGGRGRGRRPFNPDDRCYQCGERGHYAYDCSRSGSSRGGGGRRSSRYSRYMSENGDFLECFFHLLFIALVITVVFMVNVLKFHTPNFLTKWHFKG